MPLIGTERLDYLSKFFCIAKVIPKLSTTQAISGSPPAAPEVSVELNEQQNIVVAQHPKNFEECHKTY